YLTVANFAYIMRKMPLDDLKTLIRRICRNFIIVSNTENQIQQALGLDASDFEDMLQYQAAKDANCDCIITRNEKDFVFSDIPVMSPASYLKTLLND
ncbi:MAG: PIN domain-containing protein, partial [Muribaculaceae bacterium]|nr:PIN domain-containing protein [Muribaculaceae bacterium]